MEAYKKIIYTSNRYYNEGLERARVRNLSGAAESLKNSLRYYKLNIQARNLLGLVYFEMGETVDAISEWVISRSLQPEQNSAERYLEAVQSNKNKLDALNQTIKKYNQVLVYCRQDSRDLAVIQLKKVMTMNPRFVKGHQLLALLYIQDGEYELAKKSLREAMRIDTNNILTLRYLKEVNARLRSESSPKKNKKDKEELVEYRSGNETIIHPADFKDRSALSTILNILLGVVIGGLIVGFLILPGMRQQAASDANDAVRQANDTISTKNQTIKVLEDQVADLENQIAEMKGEQDSSQDVLSVYEQLITAYDAYIQENVEESNEALIHVDAAALTGKVSEYYQNLSAKVNAEYIVTLYAQGEKAYKERNYEEAAEKIQQVIDVDETYDDSYAVYYLAQSYRNLDQNELAILYYQKVIEQVPGSNRARDSQQYIKQLQPDN